MTKTSKNWSNFNRKTYLNSPRKSPKSSVSIGSPISKDTVTPREFPRLVDRNLKDDSSKDLIKPTHIMTSLKSPKREYSLNIKDLYVRMQKRKLSHDFGDQQGISATTPHFKEAKTSLLFKSDLESMVRSIT